ncbi:putative hydroxymethylpyrimidine transporter CytX [Eubacteriaceae bacterium ES2]|nr:putative hydroxymethylpyrimidine transporter CytX [Eubacteriaceae bacterium ES2]
MKNEKTSVFSNGLIWFGAGVSIAEILTGMLVAPLGFSKGLAAIILGHLIGGALMYLAGIIGAKTKKSSMETVKMSFGEKGSLLFSSLNMLQLLGWTAVMIVSGASAAGAIWDLGGNWIWSLIIGLLIIVWLLIGLENLNIINMVAMTALFILTIIMSVVIFKDHQLVAVSNSTISFGAAVELSAAMPISWLPLISDYTRFAKREQASTITSVLVYSLVSCWMFVIGMGAVLFTGQEDVASIMLKAGLGIAGLIIIVFSTVTTTFLDAFSAGVSAFSISKKLNEKWAAVFICVIGTILAIFTPTNQFENFLYLIGSVFAPMISIQVVNYFILKRDSSHKAFNYINMIIWLIGFVIYRAFMVIDTPVGNTLPVMLITGLICFGANKLFGGKKNVERNPEECA